MRFGLFTTFAIALLLPVTAFAQSFGNLIGSTSSFTVSVNPQYPTPYSQAVLSFLSSNIDLTNAAMTVSVAGKKIYQGSVQPTSIPLGKAGSATMVVVAIASGGTNYSQTILIQPQDVALIAEPISSAPVLYQGKPSVPLEGNVRVVAVANLRGASGKILDPNTLSYAWAVDGTQIANSSGIGKETIIVASPLQYRSREVSVTVMSSDDSLVGGDSLLLTALEPAVRVYENDPLLGIRFDRALSGTYAINGTEATLFAAPFSLPTTSGAPLLQWFLNGTAAQTGNSITLRPTGNGQGSASLSLVASAGDYSKVTANLSLSFGATGGFNLFGL
jgi:hypothetical protein